MAGFQNTDSIDPRKGGLRRVCTRCGTMFHPSGKLCKLCDYCWNNRRTHANEIKLYGLVFKRKKRGSKPANARRLN